MLQLQGELIADKSLDAQKTGLLKGVRKRLFLQRLRSSLSTIILLVSSAIFIFLLIDVSEGDVIGIDRFAYRLFVVHLRTPLLTEIMEGFSGLASPENPSIISVRRGVLRWTTKSL